VRKWLLRIKAYFVGDELVALGDVALIDLDPSPEVEEIGRAIGPNERAVGELDILQEEYDVVSGLSDPVTRVRHDSTRGWSIDESGAAQ
jgi:hypothetical protein